MSAAEDPIRDEAHRLVVAALAAASVAANGLAGTHLANGSAECCICPICRVIAAVRDPSPDFSERLAEGAADLAVGVASLLRNLSGSTVPPQSPADQPAGEPDPPEAGDDAWRQATATPPRAPMARKVAKKAAPRTPPPPSDTAMAPATGQDVRDEGTEDST